MAGFEREFIIHLQSIGESNSNKPLTTNGAMKEKRDSQNVYKRLRKKYRKQWWASGASKKKFDWQKRKKLKHGIFSSNDVWMGNQQTSWSEFHSRADTSNCTNLRKEPRNFNSSLMNSETFCTDFPITGISQEFSGIRDNGNSPFNSSNSCGSPEGLTSQEQGSAKPASASCTDTQSCCEQNNNSQNNGCLCGVNKDCLESQLPEVPDTPLLQKVSDKEAVIYSSYELQPDSLVKTGGHQNSVQNKVDKPKSCVINQHCDSQVVPKPSTTDSSEVNVTNSSLNTRTSSRRKSVLTPIAWQQQFMSFLSTPQEEEEETCPSNDPDFVCHVDKVPAKISRRRRSRNVKNNSCACCIDAESHSKKEKQSRQHEKKLLKEQKHFIQDMMRLVSLRNKIVLLLQCLLPADLKHTVKAETESVDEFIEFVMRVIRSSNREKDLESEDTDIHSLHKYQDESECLHDEMPVLENCTAYVSNISSNISSPPPTSRFQSLSDSGIVQDQSFTCEATCETISVNVDFANDQQTNVDSDYQGFLPTNKPREMISSEALPDGTHMVIENEVMKDASQEKVICASVQEMVPMDIEDAQPPTVSTAPSEVPMEDHDIDNKSDDDKSNDKVPTTSDVLVDNCENDVHVLDKLASVLANGDSKSTSASRSDPLMELLAVEKTSETFPTESKNEMAVQGLTCVVETPRDAGNEEGVANTESSTVKVVEVFEPSVVLCKKPKKCLKMFMKKVHSLLHRLLPGVHFEHHFFRNSDNLEYLLDAIIQSNQELSVDV